MHCLFRLIFMLLLSPLSITSDDLRLKESIGPSIEAKFCAKPAFWDSLCKGNYPLRIDIYKTLEFKFSQMPFKESLWIHVDIFNKGTIKKSEDEIEISEIAIALSNLQGDPIGQFTEEIPCKENHQFMTKIGHNYSELIDLVELDKEKDDSTNLTNWKIKGIEVHECPGKDGINKNHPPTQAFIKFKKPVKAFYFHYKFTPAEWKSIIELLPAGSDSGIDAKSGFQIITTLVDNSKDCYTFVSNYYKVNEHRTHQAKIEKMKFTVPLDCHIAEAVTSYDYSGDPEKLVIKSEPVYQKLIDSIREHPPKSLIKRPKAENSDQTQIDEYNKEKYFVKFFNDTFRPVEILKISYKSRRVIIRSKGKSVKTNSKTPQTQATPENRREELYKECGRSKSCLGEPSGCLKTFSCHTIISYGEDKDHVKFEILGTSWKYFAIGLSKDKLMGDDSVVECVREHEDVIRVYMSWNTQINGKNGNKRLPKEFQNLISQVYGSFNDGVIYCSFIRPKNTTIYGINFDLQNTKFYVFSASGSSSSEGLDGNIEKHDTVRIMKDTVNLYYSIVKSKEQFFIIKCHGVAMITVWIILVPIASFFSRYFKETFIKVSILGYSVWYMVHTVFMSFSILLTILSACLIYWFEDHWPGGKQWSFHSGSGIAMIILMSLQVPLAIGIIKFNSKYKYLFLNRLHGINGHLLFFVGFTSLFKSRKMMEGLPCEAAGPLIGWIITYMIIHLIISYQVCYSDFVQGRNVSRIYSLGSLDVPERTKLDKEEPGAQARKVFLGFFIFFALLFGIILYVQYLNLTWKKRYDCTRNEYHKPKIQYMF